MNKTKYSKILVGIMSIMMCGLIGIQFYLTLYIGKQHGAFPEILTWIGLFLEVGLLAILLASSNVNKAVGNLAFTDVTGIKNKLAYQEHIRRIEEKSDTFSIGVIMFDLINLKKVNDELGHEVGDHYIEAFSEILSQEQNGRISAYRVGGDEFAMILEETNAVEIHHVLDRMEHAVMEYNSKHRIQISYARGYEISTQGHYYLIEELARRADEHMYQNKQICKNNKQLSKNNKQLSKKNG